jgi:predicted nucleic acid-binding protein
MSFSVCIDANVLVMALIAGPLADRANALFAQWQRDDVQLIAPMLFAYEVPSAIRRAVHLKQVTSTEGDAAFEKFLRLPVRLSTRREVIPIAWELAKQFSRPQIYDATYLAVAQINDCDFWTADEKLYNVVRDELDWVRWLGDYPR